MQQSSTSRESFSGRLPFGPKTLVIGAAALVAYGLTRRSKAGTAIAAAGSLLAYKAAQDSSSRTSTTHAIFLVNASPDDAYRLWRNFSGLPRFMVHLKSVREVSGKRSVWVALGSDKREIRWNAEITEDRAGERIAWRSLPDSDVVTSGSVDFRADPQGRGTFVTVAVQYSLPGGSLTNGLATLLGKSPDFVVREDVRRFKQLLETGEVTTTRGQSHGPRGIYGHTEHLLFREKSNLPDPPIASASGQSA
jgi:uncharacterized membrane protein